MKNEQYLIVSYFVCACLSIALGALVYLFLRRPFSWVADAATGKHFGSALKKLFPVGLLLPALLGFVSVSYMSCDRSTYAAIVESRRYLIEVNQKQISWILISIVIAVLVWDFIILFVLKISQRTRKES